MIHRVDMPRCTGAGPGGASIVQAAASHDIVHGWMDGAVCAWMSMYTACTWSRTNRMGNASMYHVRIHPSIHHAWMDPSMHPSMHDERERGGLDFTFFNGIFPNTCLQRSHLNVHAA